MSCNERTRLLEAYQVATAGYADAVVLLERFRGTTPQTDYNVLYRITENARQKAAAAREALFTHLSHCADHDIENVA